MNAMITADLVKELRARTGGGFLECKKALDAANGDLELAVDAMRKSGQAKAAKKTGRIAAEGIIGIRVSTDNKTAIMVEVNCETDFVALDPNFRNFVQTVVDRGLFSKADTLDKLLAVPYDDQGKTIAKACEELIVKIGENIQIRRIAFLESPYFLAHYLHSNRIGVLVEFSTADSVLSKDIAMHIAASRPQYISSEDVSVDEVNREKEIYLSQAIASGKPQAIAEKMTEGRLKKFFAEITLLDQPFVKDPSFTINDLLQKTKAKVLSFKRFEVGEGITKKHEDFAAEVEAQIKAKKKE